MHYDVTDDAVYLSDEEEREEYVLNDVGIIYRGTTKWISPKKWNFGQVSKTVVANETMNMRKSAKIMLTLTRMGILGRKFSFKHTPAAGAR